MKNMINLLPVSFLRQQIVRKRATQWCAIISTVLTIGWGWHLFEHREQIGLFQQLESLQREHRPAKTMLKQLVEMRQQLDELQQQELVARELEHHRDALTLLGVISNTTQATKGRVRVTKVQLTNFQNLRTTSFGDERAKTDDGLVLTGVSLDNPAVAELVDGLSDSGVFSRVELVLSKERPNSEVSLRDYEVRCEF